VLRNILVVIYSFNLVNLHRSLFCESQLMFS